ncbi:MAG: enolase [Betaproteobacteria bacterium]|nr:enolase [Betaproteobacteria bacterium]
MAASRSAARPRTSRNRYAKAWPSGASSCAISTFSFKGAAMKPDVSPYMRYRDLSVRGIEAIPVAIPLLRPIKWARGEIHTIDNVVIVVTLSDGTQGIADAPPRPTIYGETQESIVAAIRKHFAPRLEGVNAFDIAGVWSALEGIAWNPTVKAGIDMALYDAQAKALGISCAQLLGGTVKPLPVNWRLSLADENHMLAEAEQQIERYGFRAFKVKCGVDRKKDVQILHALRKLVGDNVEIAIDCNQGYSSQDLLETGACFEELGIALIEEPIPARDSAGKRFAAERTRVPISGDDSCMTPDDVLDQLKLGAIRAVVIKCARTGYTQSRQILALARAYYTPVHNGTQADMHIGTASGGHFACTYEAVHAHEISSFLDAKDHVAEQELLIKDGLLHLPEGPGIGLTLDQAKLKRYRIDQ